ncbi:MAG: 4-hydroxy-tetrahydrodipicolinate reductase, partial [Starkeya sp.]|nr:4-hydroxy-tetrahydrodipicolinate reductase [Starkeya sp.]
MTQTRLVVVGASGRMGRVLVRAISEAADLVLVGAVDQPGSEYLGRDAGELAGLPPLGLNVSDDPLPLFAAADGVIDFTIPAASVAYAAFAAQARIVHVIGTTGFSAEDEAKIAAAARHAAIVRSGNMSLGVNLLAALVRRVARTLDEDFDIEIVDCSSQIGSGALPLETLPSAGFAIRPAALAPYLALGLDWADYPAEPIPDDGTL